MVTRTWTPLTSGHYDDLTNWGGVAPQPGETDVISSVGGSAPTIPNHIYQTGGTASQIYLYNFAFPPLPEDAALAQVPTGDTISGQTIDVQGDNNYTVIDIRRTTLAASTTLNDPSTMIMNADYDNFLDGTINIGQPGVAPALPDNTYTRLNLNVYGYGSVDLHGGPPSTYRPDTTNNGTINAADSSWLDIQLITGQAAQPSFRPSSAIWSRSRAPFPASRTSPTTARATSRQGPCSTWRTAGRRPARITARSPTTATS